MNLCYWGNVGLIHYIWIRGIGHTSTDTYYLRKTTIQKAILLKRSQSFQSFFFQVRSIQTPQIHWSCSWICLFNHPLPYPTSVPLSKDKSIFYFLAWYIGVSLTPDPLLTTCICSLDLVYTLPSSHRVSELCLVWQLRREMTVRRKRALRSLVKNPLNWRIKNNKEILGKVWYCTTI